MAQKVTIEISENDEATVQLNFTFSPPVADESPAALANHPSIAIKTAVQLMIFIEALQHQYNMLEKEEEEAKGAGRPAPGECCGSGTCCDGAVATTILESGFDDPSSSPSAAEAEAAPSVEIPESPYTAEAPDNSAPPSYESSDSDSSSAGYDSSDSGSSSDCGGCDSGGGCDGGGGGD